MSERHQLAQDAGFDPTGKGYSGFNLVHNVESDSEVDELIASAVSAGGRVVKEPQRADWGGYHGYFCDPDGHLWEIAHNPFAWIGPADE